MKPHKWQVVASLVQLSLQGWHLIREARLLPADEVVEGAVVNLLPSYCGLTCTQYSTSPSTLLIYFLAPLFTYYLKQLPNANCLAASVSDLWSTRIGTKNAFLRLYLSAKTLDDGRENGPRLTLVINHDWGKKLGMGGGLYQIGQVEANSTIDCSTKIDFNYWVGMAVSWATCWPVVA